MLTILFQIWPFILFLTTGFGLQVNFYTSLGQIRQEVSFEDGYLQMYFPNQEYNAIVP